MLNARNMLEATGGVIITDDTSGSRKAAQLSEDILFPGLSIDSRTIKPGELFIALKGDRFDGHDFLSDALRLGAGAIISRDFAAARGPKTFGGKSIILVDDTLSALHAIARSVRKQFGAALSVLSAATGRRPQRNL